MSQQSQPPPTPLTIGRSFIQQYYRVLTSSKPSDAKRFYLLDTSQISNSLQPDVAVVPMPMNNTSNSNGDDDEAEISGGSVVNVNDPFGWARLLLLDNNSDSSTIITWLLLFLQILKMKRLISTVTTTIVAHHHLKNQP